ncbi:hypothetical protein MUP38_00835, partial [Candidatus Bathyarchaeota archaeon]|nr:hypothetical protein [Candidatus Bathyarchaeota archaeon]
MRKTVLAVTVILVLTAAAFLAGANPALGDALVEDSWTTVAPLPKPYYDNLGAAVVNGKIYFFGEEIAERYDPGTNTWTAVTPPPIYHMWGEITACKNKIYLIGGTEDDPTQVYDTATDTWGNRTPLPGVAFGHRANVVGDKIYLISGAQYAPLGIFAFSDANYVYDPTTDSWSKMAPIPTPVSSYASAVLDNKIYIIGGRTATDVSYVANTTDMVQIFDPKTNQWTTGPSIPTGVYAAGACSTSGLAAPKRIYVVGGWKTNLTQVYDSETG